MFFNNTVHLTNNISQLEKITNRIMGNDVIWKFCRRSYTLLKSEKNKNIEYTAIDPKIIIKYLFPKNSEYFNLIKKCSIKERD